jgi:hypothetical protein
MKKTYVEVSFVLLGIALAIFFGAYSYCLLARKMLSGAEFVAFSLGGFAFSFIVGLAGRVSEFSIAGNVVKIREATASAEEAYIKLNSVILGALRANLLSVQKLGGGFDSISIPYDSRASDLLELVKTIEESGLSAQLKSEVRSATENIMKGQLNKISQSSPGVEEHIIKSTDFEFPTQKQLLVWNSEKQATNNELAISSIEWYEKLHKIRAQYT